MLEAQIFIKCPNCGAKMRVYHMKWDAIVCDVCDIELANPTRIRG